MEPPEPSLPLLQPPFQPPHNRFGYTFPVVGVQYIGFFLWVAHEQRFDQRIREFGETIEQEVEVAHQCIFGQTKGGQLFQ
jgi:hypothetical protein